MSEIDNLFPRRDDHSEWMDRSLRLAEKAFEQDEVPVGAILIKNGRVIGKGYNQKERLKDPTAHAEILAITAASSTIGDWRLKDCTLYVTKEPCSMCAGAIINARISLLVFGAYDESAGCCGSKYQLCGDHRIGSKTSVIGGVKEQECLQLLKDFFIKHRKKMNN